MRKLFIFASFLLLISGVFVVRAEAATVTLSGQAWSDNYGWVSFRGSNYGVSIDTATGLLSGQAWSESMGWLSFSSADLTGCPSGNCEAKLDLVSSKLSGWGKFTTAGQWLHLSPASGSSYGVTYDSSGQFMGEGWSDYAGWVKFQGSTYAVVTDSCIVNCAGIPNAPSSLDAQTASKTQINLDWQDNSTNETGFKIERKTGLNGTYSQIATVGVNIESYNNTGLTNNTTYYYRVRAYNASGNSAYSNEDNATTANVPAAPTIGPLTVLSQSSIKIQWVNNDTIQNGNVIERAPTHDGPWTTITTANPLATSYTNTGLTKGTTYYYKMHATSSNGDSADSEIISATTFTTTTISVTTSPSASWTITNNSTGTQVQGTGNQTITVTPDPEGTQYTITGGVLSGYNWPPTAGCDYGDGAGIHEPCSMLYLVGGEGAEFFLTYENECPGGCEPVDLNYSLSPASQEITIKKASDPQYGNVTVSKNFISGTTGLVSLDAISGVPSGVSLSFVNRSCTPTCSTTVQFEVDPSASVGDYIIRFNGSPVPDGNGNNNANVTLHILPSDGVLVTCAVDPSQVDINEDATWSVTHKEGGNGDYTGTQWFSGNVEISGAIGDTYTTAYPTSGIKSLRARVADSAGNIGYCPSPQLRVGSNPGFEEF